MKLKYYFPLLLCLAYASCVTYAQFDNRALAARTPVDGAFLIFKDGKTVTGKILKHRNYDPYDHNQARFTGKPNAFNLDGKDYSDDNVIAYQDQKAFHKLLGGLYLTRLATGKINLYYYDDNQQSYNAATSKYEITHRTMYFFEKEKDKMVKVGIPELKEAVKDNTNALNQLNDYFPKDHYAKNLNVEKLAAVINLYNQ